MAGHSERQISTGLGVQALSQLERQLFQNEPRPERPPGHAENADLEPRAQSDVRFACSTPESGRSAFGQLRSDGMSKLGFEAVVAGAQRRSIYTVLSRRKRHVG
jgi:hypothetical protein